MANCPFCHRGALHIIAAISQEEVTTRILRHLKLASVPPPIAPARLRQEIFAFDEAPVSAHRGGVRCGSVCQRFSLALPPPSWLSPPVDVKPLTAGTSQVDR